MVNHRVTPKGDGSGYRLCTDNHVLKEWNSEYHDRYGKDTQVGEPRDVYAFRVFHGNYTALDDCIARGVVRQKTGADIIYHHGSFL